MNLISEIKKIEKEISGKILFDESLSKHSWFNLGGPAKIIFKPKNLNDLSFFLKNYNEPNKIKVLGVGSNILIRDGGFDGSYHKIRKTFFTDLSLLGSKILLIAGASALDKSVSSVCHVKIQLSGL